MDAYESARNTRLWFVEKKTCRRKELKKLFSFLVKSRRCQRQDSADSFTRQVRFAHHSFRSIQQTLKVR
jgi:hypothetical protein